MPNHRKAAAEIAESKVGHSTPHGESGWCLEWTVRDVINYQGPCRWAGNGRPWAINFWLAAKKWGRVVETSDPTRIPRGALVFTKGRSVYGHVFIALGNGYCASTDYPTARKIGKARITDLLAGWGHVLLGYVEITGDGLDLRDSGPVDQLDPANYYIGAHGAHVLWIGQRLVAHGVGSWRYKPTTDFTAADVKKIAAFQRAQGWRGQGADGLPGVLTLRLLAQRAPNEPVEP